MEKNKKDLIMKITKKNIPFLLLLTTIFSSQGMESQKPSYTKTVRNILRGHAPINALWQRPRQPGVTSNIIIIDPFPFTNLLKDVQNRIIYFLSLYSTAHSLQVAAFTINSLAQVNHELNQLINNPKFCLELIKGLAIKFNCSDQTACIVLHTQEAKRRLDIQNQLYLLCTAASGEVSSFESLLEQGVDLNFTYRFDINLELCQTPLMLASLLNGRMTQKLCTFKNININQRNTEGKTALMLAIEDGMSNNVKTLLNAGADPEIADNDELTPLQAAENTHNQNIIKLIQDAINKKHEKK